MSDGKKKFEIPSLQSLVDGVKDLVNPEGVKAAADPDDALGQQLEQLVVLVKSIEQEQKDFVAAQNQRLREIADLANSVYANVEALRGSAGNDKAK